MAAAGSEASTASTAMAAKTSGARLVHSRSDYKHKYRGNQTRPDATKLRHRNLLMPYAPHHQTSRTPLILVNYSVDVDVCNEIRNKAPLDFPRVARMVSAENGLPLHKFSGG
jgi:hypothetical protein